MALGSFDTGERQPMAEINTTPLVDVMLVLLIIFMVTAPLFTHAVKIDLPHARSQLNLEHPTTIALAIDGTGKIYWNDQPIGADALADRFAQAVAEAPQSELHIRADRDTRYQVIAKVMADAQRAGMKRIGFVTDPAQPRR